MGPHGYTDTWRDEDWRPRHTGEPYLCWRPIKPSSLYDIANREFVALGIQTWKIVQNLPPSGGSVLAVAFRLERVARSLANLRL